MSYRRKVIMLSNDGIITKLGGLGIFQEQLVRHMSDTYFIILGPESDKPHRGKNYTYYPISWLSPNRGSRVMKALKGATLIHANDAPVFDLSLALRNKLKIPMLAQIHLSDNELIKDLAKHMGFAPFLAANYHSEKRGMNNADMIVHVSNAYARRMPSYGNPVMVAHNGITVSDFTKPVPRVNLPGNPNSRKILYIGRFTSQKGVTHFPNLRIPRNCELYIIGGIRGGDAYIANSVMNWAAKQPNVHYLGEMWGDDKVSVMQRADAQLIPSLHEPFGIVGLEAMATKSIPITSFANGLSDFIPKDIAINSGYNANSLQNAINHFAMLPDNAMKAIQNAGFPVANKFTWSKTAERFSFIYNQLQPSNIYNHA